MTGRLWDLELLGERPLTVNAVATMHRQAWARHTRQTREAWGWLAKGAQIPHLRRITVTVWPLHANRRSPQDVAACAPEVKAAIDGLVDARVIPDDNPTYLAHVLFLPPLIGGGKDGLRLRIQEAA